MKIIRGTGDAKKLKGQALPQKTTTMRCTNCGQQAVQGRLPNGREVYTCVACGTSFTASKF